jgi:hypothetical protein
MCPAIHTSAPSNAYILDGSEILASYLQEILKVMLMMTSNMVFYRISCFLTFILLIFQSGRFPDLDICEANTFFENHPVEGLGESFLHRCID